MLISDRMLIKSVKVGLMDQYNRKQSVVKKKPIDLSPRCIRHRCQGASKITSSTLPLFRTEMLTFKKLQYQILLQNNFFLLECRASATIITVVR